MYIIRLGGLSPLDWCAFIARLYCRVRLMLSTSSRWGAIWIFAAVLILFSIPVTLLVRSLHLQSGWRWMTLNMQVAFQDGFNAILDSGSFVGTFLPVLVFIPWWVRL